MIVTFGEIMLRLSPPGHQRFLQSKQFDAGFGGGEANVAVMLANLGVNSRFVTCLPDNDMGKACIGELKRWGVDTSCIASGKGRMGIYFCEKGASQRPSKVIYDRMHSVITNAKFDWNTVFEGAQWFHFTGITPALGDNVADMVKQACIAAKNRGIKVSCDINYRKNLWTKEKARAVMTGLMDFVDVLIGNEQDAEDVFGISSQNSDITAGKINVDGYISVASQLKEKFGFEKVALTLRESISASVNNWSALLYGDNAVVSRKYSIDIVDRVGSGDSFAAGIIYGLTSGRNDRETVEFASAASCLKHTVEGDLNIISLEEIENLAAGDGSGRVVR